jgi:hypothetical protein
MRCKCGVACPQAVSPPGLRGILHYAKSGGAMSHLMKLAEALRDIAEECSKSEIEKALGLCMGFADRVRTEPGDAEEYPESGQPISITCSGLPN